MDIKASQLMDTIGQAAKDVAYELSGSTAEQRTQALLEMAGALRAATDDILAANAKDMEYGRDKGLSAAMLDRLELNEERIDGIISSIEAIAGQDDPVGAVTEEWDRPSGLHIKRVRTPLGVIGVIYESRPNVTADAAALCLRSGNAVILRGGSESLHSATAIAEAMRAGLEKSDIHPDAVQLVPVRDREMVGEMLRATDYIDVIVPRGGKGLVGLVQSEARVPVFAHLEGICHIYVDKDADPEKARKVVLNAKTRRTGICGAAECVLFHKDIADTLGAQILDDLRDAGVEIVGAEGFGIEFLDSKIAHGVVDTIDAAISHIVQYHSAHTDAIITEDDAAAKHFFKSIDSAILMRNASTQFADGGEFGMGAEIGIATGKMHARGPVGAAQLTSFKYLVEGDGTTRP